MSGCLRCGATPIRLHHPSGRNADGEYFDPRFVVPVCPTCHDLDHRVLRALDLNVAMVPSVRNRRLAVFGWSLVGDPDADSTPP